MNYTEDEIGRYIEILKSVDLPPKSKKVSCKYYTGYCYRLNCFLVLVMFLVITINLISNDFTFEKKKKLSKKVSLSK